MLKQRTKSLRDRTVVTAARLSLMGGNAHAGPIGGASSNDRKTDSPIKHVIVIVGENRTFDHVFATYEPHEGEHVDNLLSKGIIKEDGSPGPNYAKAAQFSTTVNNFYSINPTPKTPYNTTTNKLRRRERPTRHRPATPPSNKLRSTVRGCLTTLSEAARGDYGLRKQDLPLLTTGATGIPGNSPDTRVLDYASLPNGPYPLVTLPQGEDETSSLY
jgi:phospholipase C